MPDHGLMIFREQGEPVLVYQWSGHPPVGLCGWGLGRGVRAPDLGRFSLVQPETPWPTPDPAGQ